jgi:transposase
MTRGTRSQWADQVRRWRASGLTARAFAARAGLNANTLRWWACTLGSEVARKAAFIEVTPSPVPIAVGRIEIVVPGGRCVRVSGEFDVALLRRVLAVLESR